MLNYDAQDLQYLQMMQENITRMAENSAVLMPKLG